MFLSFLEKFLWDIVLEVIDSPTHMYSGNYDIFNIN